MWQQVLAVIGIIALIFLFFWFKRHNPEMFSGKNISKSFTTIGVVGLCLIAFVAVLVLITKHT